MKLGFQLLLEEPIGNGLHWVQLGFPQQSTTIALVEWLQEMPAGSLQGLILESEDLERDLNDLRNKGIDIARVDDSPRGKIATLIDPDGNGLLLHQNKK